MAGSQITVSQTQLESQRYGYHSISLTNFDNTSEPEIAEGSKVEIGGSLFNFSADESISGWGGIGTSNTVWVKLVVSGTSVTAEFTTTPPTWDMAKQGWYDGNDRYVAELYKDGAGNAVNKYPLERRQTLEPRATAEEILTEDTSNRTQASPATGTWYNLGSLSITLTPGRWLLSFEVVIEAYKAGSTTRAWTCLSTAPNSCSDIGFRTYSGESELVYATVGRSKVVTITTTTTYYLNGMTDVASSDWITFGGVAGTTRLRALRL